MRAPRGRSERRLVRDLLLEEAAMRPLDEPAEARTLGDRLTRGFPRITLALSAFIMSLVVTLIGAYYALQGPEILVRAPEQVVLYRDGAGESSVLGFALRLDMINSAGDYGDVMLEAELSPVPSGPTFHYQSVLRPVFTVAAEEEAKDCELGARCIGLPGLLLVEQPDELVALAGGSARAMHLSFPAAEWNCQGAARDCAAYANFDRATAAVAARPLDIRVTVHFNSDGERSIRCRTGRVDGAYLRQIGWVSLTCETREVHGTPWL